MKRGFLNNKKAQKTALNPNSSSSKNDVKSSVGAVAMKLPYGKMENTALPTSYTPTGLSIVEYDAKKTDHADNMLIVTTIPSRVIGKPRDPDGHSEWLVYGPTKKKVLNAPGYPHPVPKSPGNVKSYVVKSTPTMGKGVFATRDISMGEIIFAERPLLVAPRALMPATDMDLSSYTVEDYSKIVMHQREQQLEVAVGRMDPDTKSRLMALMNSHLEDGSGPINGIVRTNGYAVNNLWDGTAEPGEDDASNQLYYSLVCDVGSRINHSCLPNISHAFKLSAFAMIFLALRDIKAGEQLFYSYCGLHQSTADRKAELAPYGIAQCVCSSCVNATTETDNIRKTFPARVMQYKRNSVIWERLGKVPPGTLDEMLSYQSAVMQEGLDTDVNYWAYFMPALIIAYQLSGKPHASIKLIQDALRWHNFVTQKAAFDELG